MSIAHTYKQLRDLLTNIGSDLEKAERGNKAASQRVRTGTVRLEKVAKVYRKESIATEKTRGPKRSAKAKSAPKGKTKSKAASHSSKGSKASAMKSKSKSAVASFKSHHLSAKRASAKLPTRRAAAYAF